jgi:hypothetical protein
MLEPQVMEARVAEVARAENQPQGTAVVLAGILILQYAQQTAAPLVVALGLE